MSGFDLDMGVWMAIGAAALTTYALRVGGLLLAGRLPQSGRFKVFLDTLPGTILLALVVPGILAEGLWGAFAALSVAVCTRKTGNLFLAMLIGVGIIAAHRHLFP